MVGAPDRGIVMEGVVADRQGGTLREVFAVDLDAVGRHHAAGQRHCEDGRYAEVLFDTLAEVGQGGFGIGDRVRGLGWRQRRQIGVDFGDAAG